MMRRPIRPADARSALQNHWPRDHPGDHHPGQRPQLRAELRPSCSRYSPPPTTG
jgi:hypothetical protein